MSLPSGGTDIDVIRAPGRHRDIRTTQRYIRTTPREHGSCSPSGHLDDGPAGHRGPVDSLAAMVDLLEDVRAQIRARIDQLRPAVDELARLEQALSALGDNPQSAPPTPAAAPRKPRQQPRKPRTPKRAKLPAEREALRARALELIGERPGITKPELRQAAGLSGQQAGQLVRRLLAAEAIEEAALPSGSTGYRTRTTSATQGHDDPPTAPGEDVKPAADPSSQATTTAA